MSNAPLNNQLLIDFAAGILSQEQAGKVELLIAKDTEARATVERYRLAASVHASDDTIEPPAGVVARAKAIFHPFAKPAVSLGEKVRTVIANLLYDSRLQPAAVRSGDSQRRVQLTYATDDVEIELQAERDLESGGAWRVMGQVAADDAPNNIQIVITPSGANSVAYETTIEGDEAFSTNLASGKYEIRAEVKGAVIVVPEVVLE